MIYVYYVYRYVPVTTNETRGMMEDYFNNQPWLPGKSPVFFHEDHP